MSGSESAEESYGCVFGTEIRRWARTKLFEDQEAPVSCGWRGSLCFDIDGVPNSHVLSTRASHEGTSPVTMLVCGTGHVMAFCFSFLSMCMISSVV